MLILKKQITSMYINKAAMILKFSPTIPPRPEAPVSRGDKEGEGHTQIVVCNRQI